MGCSPRFGSRLLIVLSEAPFRALAFGRGSRGSGTLDRWYAAPQILDGPHVTEHCFRLLQSTARQLLIRQEPGRQPSKTVDHINSSVSNRFEASSLEDPEDSSTRHLLPTIP